MYTHPKDHSCDVSVDIVTMKGKNIIFDPIAMKFHRNDPGDVHVH
jgi:hypothetical protein